MLQTSGKYPRLLDDQRLFDAVDSMILYQNNTGGVSAFEARNGSPYLELLNISEMWSNFMVDYDYPECTASCVAAICLFQRHWPEYRKQDLDNFVRRGIQWIKSQQLSDGSWYGSWGICYTYGTMFALEGLAAGAERYSNSLSSRRACHFLLSKQREDGGWSESIQVSFVVVAVATTDNQSLYVT